MSAYVFAPKLKKIAFAIAMMSTISLTGCSSSSTSSTPAIISQNIKHVLLISVDGLHQADLANWIKANPTSNLAKLSANSVTYTDAHTPTPSDSFPGLLALVTGGTPKSTGVYYDDSYDRTLYAPGSQCAIPAGTQVLYDESVDYDMSKLFSGGVNPANLPLQKDVNGNCRPVYPHDFIKVNTLFEVVKANGGITAWSDKHPTYDLVNGPSGAGVMDLYTPEINSDIAYDQTFNGVTMPSASACTISNALASVSDYTTCIPAIEAYDDVKVQSIVNEIDGKRSDGSAGSGVPTIFGMNFQEVSVAQKLPIGGYSDATGTPSANLANALAHTDASLGRMVAELKAKNLMDSTLIIITAKHGQSPIDKSKLATKSGGLGNTFVTDPQDTVNTVDAGVDTTTFTNPITTNAYPVAGHVMTDDVGLVWLQNQASTNVNNVISALTSAASAIGASTLPAGTIFTSNITSGAALAAIFGDPTSTDPIAAARAPNVFIQPNYGVVYTGKSAKIAEHGGGTNDDTNVALMLSSTAFKSSATVSDHVWTKQVAPTILKVLGMDSNALQAVVKESTALLPNLF